jgi:NAD+ diphosphatase
MINDIHPHRFDNHYLPGRTIGPEDYLLLYRGNAILLKETGSACELPRRSDFPDLPESPAPIFLFTFDEVACFLIRDEPRESPPGCIFTELSFFRTTRRQEIAWISLVGYHLANWYAQHRFCGRCGTGMNHKPDERALGCHACGHVAFPVIAPAVIVAITCRDRILLARGSNFQGGWYSLIAGYVDAGESLEETLRREVKEEVGLDIHNIRYYGSQPWPLSGSMMIGFTAEADDEQPLAVDQTELAEAAWFERGNLPKHSLNLSIAGEMIEKFDRGELPGEEKSTGK